eukprot:s2564_g24.t2
MAPAPSKIYDDDLDDIFRMVARKFPEVTDWLCPITGLLMPDAVVAADHFNYSEAAMRKWFATTCSGSLSSPQTKEPMSNHLEPNHDLRHAIKAFRDFVFGTAETLALTWEHHGMRRGEMRNVTLSRDDVSKRDAVQMCQALSKFFKELDPIEDLLRRMLRGLKPPKIVVVGDESAGKSTILEMLAMLPFFPRKRRCCTRLAIHLRLRRTPGISRATLTVLSAEGEEELSREIPQENGWLIVQEEMERLQKELFGSGKEERIIAEKSIVVKVERPDVPCLDLVDLPGMTQTPKEKAEQVRKIYDRQLKDDRDSGEQCMYLAVVPASGEVRPSNNPVMKFIIEEGLQDRTFGIFSKCDQNSEADVLRALALNESTEDDEPAESLGGVKLCNGWVATMQKLPPGEHFKYHNFDRMYIQQKQEAEWFQNPDTPERKQHWPRLVEKNSAGIADLVPRVQNMYLRNLQVVWKEHAMLQILEKEAETELHLRLLGVEEDEEKKKQLAKQEVQRRLGPNSEVTKKMYDSFVAEVLNTAVVKQVREILAEFAVGKCCPGHIFPKLLQQTKEKLLELMELVLSKMDACMVGAVKNILLAKSELCKDGFCDFNIQTASLRLYSTGTCSSQWEVQEKLKAEPIIQLCHYKDYVDEIIKKHTDMLNEKKRRLRESLETLINRLVDVDSSSPYLEVASAFLDQKANELDYTDSRVIISCKCKQFLDAFLRCCLQHVPHPDQLQDLYEDISVGSETPTARKAFNRFKEELGLVLRAKESIIRALAIEHEDLRSIKNKFEVEQHAKVESDAMERSEVTATWKLRSAGDAVETVAVAASSSLRAIEDADEAGEEKIQLEADAEKCMANPDSANIVTPSGSGSWDPITSQSTPTSEARKDARGGELDQLFDFDHLDAKIDAEPEEFKDSANSESNAVNMAHVFSADLLSLKQKKAQKLTQLTSEQ